ncbi:hypothetical protein L1987_56727 [Smallanthus sonchifolius]|uniref:Uncharacterized protein n=1 Tax=Smallanthus sonchifolius TaxID=185202 RepID=A0ACB9DB21_9ASTR|nr:hypothetical protein L1987_56727 [Smallanthus sonchifolius]
MIPSGCQNPPLKQPPDPSLVDPTITPSLDNPKIDVSPQSGEEHTASLPIPASEGAGKSTYLTNGIQSRASPYDRSSSGGATRRKGSRMHRREKPQMESPNFPPNLSPVGSGISDSPKAPVEDALPSQPKAHAGLATSGTNPVPVKAALPSANVSDEDGFTIVNRKGKNKTIKLQRKKKQVVVRANTNGLKSNMKNTTVSVDTCKQVAGPSYSNVVGSGFNFARAVQGAKVKPVKPPIQQPLSSSQTPGPGLPRSRSADPPPPVHSSSMEVVTPPGRSNNRFAVLNSISELDPFDQSSGTGTTFSELDIHASIKRTSLVEASSDLYPPDPMNEDGSTAGRFLSDDKDDAAGKGATEKEKLFCQVNREHVEGARLLPNSVLSSPSPGGIHSSNGGKSYGITESQRKAIGDRISASSNICIDETVNWCPGEWDYFNDLCISLGLDPDYCIEDVESDTENGTAQFFSGLLKEGCPKSNRKRVSVSRYGDWDSLVAILIWYIRMRFWPLVYTRFTIVFWPIMVMAIRMEIRNFGLGANFLVGFIFPGFWACVGALLTYPQYFDFSSWEFRPKFWCLAQFEGPMHGFVFDTCNILFYLLIRKNRLKVGPMGVFFNGHYLKGYWAWSWALQPIVQLKVLPPLEFQPKARISAQIEGPNRGVDIGTYNNLLYLNVVVRANTNGLKSNMKNTTVSVDTCKQVAGPSYSNVVGSGFNFARAVQGAKVKPVKPPIQQPLSSSQTPGPGLPRSNNRFAVLNSISELDPFDQSSGTGTTFSELDIHASIKRTSLVEASSDLYPPDPMNEDGSTAGRFLSDDKDDAAGKGATEKEKLFCQVNREHVEGARLLPNSVLSSPSPGGIHSSNGGKSYGITESQRKAIGDRISASSNICIDETVNWCPGEWDYFNDLCISLGLDPDYCIEDVESDTENGTAQFFSGLLKEGCPKSNRKRVSVSRYGDWDSLVAILIWYIRMRFWPLVYTRFTIVFWPIMVMAIRMEIRNFGLGANFLVGFIFPGFWACVGALLTYPQYFDFSSWEFRPKFWCLAQFEGPMHGFVFDTCNILFYLLIRKNRLKVGPMGVFFNGHYLKGYWAWSWALQPIVQLKVLPPLEFQPKARISAQIEGPNRGVDIGTYNNLLYLNFDLVGPACLNMSHVWYGLPGL